MMSVKRLKREIEHGRVILEKGERIWNWSSPAGRIRWERRCRFFTSFLKGRQKNVLEIGCGTGLFTECFARTDNNIFAIDISQELLDEARKRVHSPNVVFKVGNAHKPDFKDSWFDYVVGSSILHHLDIETALKNIFHLLKPGGKFLFTEPNMMNPQIALQKNIYFLKKWAGDSPDETAFVRWRIRKKIQRQGFINVRVEPFDFLHPAMPRFLLPVIEPATTQLESLPLIKEIAGSMIIAAEKSIKTGGGNVP